MAQNNKIVATNTFDGGVNSDLSDEHLPSNVARYFYNCVILSSAQGDMGIVVNSLGNRIVNFSLPEGVNKTLGAAIDEERNVFVFAVWNSNGYHGWYKFDTVSRGVQKVIRMIDDTGGQQIWNWNDTDLILHANIIDNNLLYWVKGGDVARKINIAKAMDKSDAGYGQTIDEIFTRAHKRTSYFAPKVEYFTEASRTNNRLYGFLFRFAQRFIYDDGEKSVWSEYSLVATPDYEPFTGSAIVSNRNNALRVNVETGSRIVVGIEIAMQKTTDTGVSVWYKIASLNKKELGLADNSTFNFNFYNDTTIIPIDEREIIQPYSFLPEFPLCQERAQNALIYANYWEGKDPVPIDMSAQVRSVPMYFDDSGGASLNNPILEISSFTDDNNNKRWTFRIGPDVVSGNKFEITINALGAISYWYYLATLFDTSLTVANGLRSSIINSFPPAYTAYYISDVVALGGGNYEFTYGFFFFGPTPAVDVYVNPVQTQTIADNGQSINHLKWSSSRKIGFVYKDRDGVEGLTNTSEMAVVNIPALNFTDTYAPVIQLTIRHQPPLDAVSYKVMTTKDLVHYSYIQLLAQKVNEATVTSSGDVYLDISLGSLFTYQKIYPNSPLEYEFKEGDRVRFLRYFNSESNWLAYPNNEATVISYKPVDTIDKFENITVDGSASVVVDSATTGNIGNYLSVNGTERLIIAVSGTSYLLDKELSTGDPEHTTKTFPFYQVINRRGVIRIKKPADARRDNSLIEVFTPSAGIISEDDFYATGLEFAISNPGTAIRAHAGNLQNQDASNPAIVEISRGDSYARSRILPTNNDIDNPQVIVTWVEDAGYSDFYRSDLSNYGRPSKAYSGEGRRRLTESVRNSQPKIDNTQINGLSMFYNEDRMDYNDKYGAINRIFYRDNKLYIFKALVDAWVPIYARVIENPDGGNQLVASQRLLNDLRHYGFDGGIGDNPESFVAMDYQLFHLSASAGAWVRVGGDGVDPVSKLYGLDKTVLSYVKSAKNARAKVFGSANKYLNEATVSIDEHPNVLYSSAFSESGFNPYAELPEGMISYVISVPPTHGTVVITGPDAFNYTPSEDYLGEDDFEYQILLGGVVIGSRHECINVVYIPGTLVWRPTAKTCVINDGGFRTGYAEFGLLEQYDTYNQVTTGLTKPNVDTDPDYVAPIYDPSACEPELSYGIFATLLHDEEFTFGLVSDVNLTIVAKDHDTGAILDTVIGDGPTWTFDLSAATGEVYFYIYGLEDGGQHITSLEVPGLRIVRLGLNNMPNLVVLDVSDNDEGADGIVNLDIDSLAHLTSLNCKQMYWTNPASAAHYIGVNMNALDLNITGSEPVKYFGYDIAPSISTQSIYDSLVTKGVTMDGPIPA